MASLGIGASSIFVNTAYQLIVAVLSTTFSDTQPSTAWTNLPLRLSRSVSRLVVLTFLNVILNVFAKGGRTVLVYH